MHLQNVVSLFDGMSCGQLALKEANITVGNYYASEIDKHAMKVTMANFPNTIQLGSVVDINPNDLPKIDLLIGGSPCQSFSFAGKRKGMVTTDNIEILTLQHYLQLKADGYQFEGQSYLFWEYVRLLKVLKPKYFLLENVQMTDKWKRIITQTLGVAPLRDKQGKDGWNSAWVSAQNRNRLYWTNIGQLPFGLFGDMQSIIPQPKDKNIMLKDILETDVDQKYFLSEKALSYLRSNTLGNYSDRLTFLNKEENPKSSCITANHSKGVPYNMITCHNMQKRGAERPSLLKNKNAGGSGHLTRTDGKTYCLDAGQTNAVEIPQIGSLKFGRTPEAKEIRKTNMANGIDTTPFAQKEISGIDFEKMNTLTTNANKDNLVFQLNHSTESGGVQPYQHNRVYDENGISPALNTDARSPAVFTKNYLQYDFSGKGHKSQQNCAFYEDGKSGTLPNARADDKVKVYNNTGNIRRLTPTECERLQTVPDGYTAHVSDTQRYRMLGNGWTVDIIAHIFKYIN